VSTAQQCFDRIAWQADLQVGSRLTAAEALPFINLAYREAWDLMVASYEDYFVKLHTPGTFTLAGGLTGNSYQITATDFYKIKGVQLLFGQRWSDPLPTFEFNEWGNPPDGLSYRQEGDTLYFEPNEMLAGWTFRLWYVYKPADLALVDTIVDVNGWVEQFIIDTVAIRVAVREEDGEPAVLMPFRQALEERIKKMAANRNVGKARRVARTRITRRNARNRTRTGMYLP
jgi:hypothetical protein